MNGAKGTTLRSVFEAANRLKAHTCAMINSYLRNVTADWVKYLLVLMTPLYFARVASFINQTRKITSSQAEELVEEQAQVFEDHKDYLIRVWDQKLTGKAQDKD